ncbi:MAG: PEP-CTERM sorting domain-containing protein, partial [Paucibacter sp.]|nr:PEP-CTERM sorting domain-containing protein [Roseateles sp.]
QMQSGVGGAFYYDAVAAVPEPRSATLLLGGMLGVGLVVRRRSRSQT